MRVRFWFIENTKTELKPSASRNCMTVVDMAGLQGADIDIASHRTCATFAGQRRRQLHEFDDQPVYSRLRAAEVKQGDNAEGQDHR
jgi:hypothetical protein